LAKALAAAPSPSRIEHAPSRRTYFSAQIEEVYPGPEQPRHNFDEAELAELLDEMTMVRRSAPAGARW